MYAAAASAKGKSLNARALHFTAYQGSRLSSLLLLIPFSHLSTLAYDNLQLWLVVLAGHDILHFPHHQQAVAQNPPKDHMLVIQPLCLCLHQQTPLKPHSNGAAAPLMGADHGVTRANEQTHRCEKELATIGVWPAICLQAEQF